MPRLPRSQLPKSGYFHVTSRGVARSTIYLDDDDHRVFVGLLVLVVRQFSWDCRAYCLMPNHFHLVLATTRDALSLGMQRLNGRYAQTFNDRHGRVGHLFQNRFKSFAIESEEHLAAACAYVLENPARAGLCA